jgi:hypothetical protein
MPVTVVQAAVVVDQSQLESGIVSINYDTSNDVSFKVMVNKGGTNYFYDLNEGSIVPLQMGSGEYTISILENLNGNKYKIVKREKVNASLSSENAVYLQSIQLVNWNEDMDIIKKAKELTVNAKTDQEKIKAVYDYVVHNMRYDYQKFSRLSSDYIPSIEEVAKDGKGICYDYAVLTAAMLRSLGVPTKLVMGYKTGMVEYHAWNQVYTEATDEWITVDTTLDSSKVQKKVTTKIQKDSTLYSVLKEY